MVLSILPRVAYYSVYRGIDLRVAEFLRKEARKNAWFVVAIDVMLIRPSSEKKFGSPEYIVASFYQILLDIRWYLNLLFKGHWIFPLAPLTALFAALLQIFCLRDPVAFKTASEAYFHSWPTPQHSEEFMATYLRFVAKSPEEYGLLPYNRRYHTLYFRYNAYKCLLRLIFRSLRPALLITQYTGYLHNYMPCEYAAEFGGHILLIGCTDRLYRLVSGRVPRQFDFVLSEQILSTNYPKLAAMGSSLLGKRIHGQVDASISYMHSSPYRTSQLLIPKESLMDFLEDYHVLENSGHTSLTRGNGFVVIFMHEFNDWHHNGVLPSFASSYYDWMLQTLKIVISCGIPYVIKLHPAIASSPQKYQQTLSGLSRLPRYFKEQLIISICQSTTELINSGMRFGLTVRGTVALELAHLKIPFVCAGRPPYADLFPGRTVNDLLSYRLAIIYYIDQKPVSDEESLTAAAYVQYNLESMKVQEVEHGNHSFNLSSASDYQSLKAIIS